MSDNSNRKVKKFFEKYWYIGIILILVSAIISIILNDNEKIQGITLLKEGLNVLVIVLDSLGTGMFIGYFIDMVQGTDDYIDYTQERIKEVLISKEFISELSQEQKTSIILKCLPYSFDCEKLNEYMSYKAKQLYQLGNGHLRSNIDYVTTAKKDKKRNIVVLHTQMSYKIYRTGNCYQPIVHRFDKNTAKICSMEIISDDEKKPYKIKKNLLSLSKEQINHNEIAYVNTIQIPGHLASKKCLTLKITVEEEGYDHWGSLIWMSLYPTNGISYKILCNDGLIIKSFHVFDNQSGLYYVQKIENDSGNVVSCTITCDTWTDPYTGFAIVISEP